MCRPRCSRSFSRTSATVAQRFTRRSRAKLSAPASSTRTVISSTASLSEGSTIQSSTARRPRRSWSCSSRISAASSLGAGMRSTASRKASSPKTHGGGARKSWISLAGTSTSLAQSSRTSSPLTPRGQWTQSSPPRARLTSRSRQRRLGRSSPARVPLAMDWDRTSLRRGYLQRYMSRTKGSSPTSRSRRSSRCTSWRQKELEVLVSWRMWRQRPSWSCSSAARSGPQNFFSARKKTTSSCMSLSG
mmetsp:Transcript_118833/g.383718  ORF Transcript_118833/g.383718 Transcript_118833/m.383718 type:complete len:246 (-) Transcript_118833:458-1195(-)